MTVGLWFALALAQVPAGDEASEPTESLPPPRLAPPDELVEAFHRSRALPLPERLKQVSEPLLGLPYLSDPLGEGQAPDLDPLARFDRFDCLTFLEEALAWGLATDLSEVARLRLLLRYGDRSPAYVHRHHFMELQWIPAAIENGLLRPLSFGETFSMEKTVDASTWAAWRPRVRFQHTDDELPSGTMALQVLPLDQALALADQIPPGTLVFTVRKDRETTPIWISHVGFMSETGVFRHATKLSGRVRDQDLRAYINGLGVLNHLPAVGLALFEPVEAPWRQPLASAP